MANWLTRLKALNPVCNAVKAHLAEGADLRARLVNGSFPNFNHFKDLRHVRNPR